MADRHVRVGLKRRLFILLPCGRTGQGFWAVLGQMHPGPGRASAGGCGADRAVRPHPAHPRLLALWLPQSSEYPAQTEPRGQAVFMVHCFILLRNKHIFISNESKTLMYSCGPDSGMLRGWWVWLRCCWDSAPPLTACGQWLPLHGAWSF